MSGTEFNLDEAPQLGVCKKLGLHWCPFGEGELNGEKCKIAQTKGFVCGESLKLIKIISHFEEIVS